MKKTCCECGDETDDVYSAGAKDYFRCRDCHEKLVRDLVRESVNSCCKVREESIVRKF